MGIFEKLFGKRQQPKSFDEIRVVFKSTKKLSEEQKNAIITIVKNGIMSNMDLDTIAIKISMCTEIYDIVILSRIKNGVEVII